MDQPITSLARAHEVFTALRQQALVRGLVLREPPPEPTSCCGRGCNGCVWEAFYDAVNYWRDEAVLLLSPG